MKKVININFQGVVVPIEEAAYESLRQYIDSLRSYFEAEDGRDEIINDIESRISELFQERLKAGAVCITENDVAGIIDNMGRPADFEEAEGIAGEPKERPEYKEQHSYSSYGQKRLFRNENHKILGGVCSGLGSYLGIDPWIVRVLFILSGLGLIAYLILWIFVPGSSSINLGYRKRLFRNPDDKVISGVCGGIGSYFSINAWIPRIIFLLPFISFFFRWQTFGPWSFPNFMKLTFSPGTFLVYVILWIIIPEAKTASEKLQMKGEKVDLNSIKESVAKEMKDVAERMGKYGKDADAFIKEKGPQFQKELHQTLNAPGNTLGNIIATLIKVFVYIIMGAVAFTVLAVVFAIAVVAVGIFPLKDFIVADGWQNVLAWLTLIFFIGVPVAGTIAFIIRAITRRKRTDNRIRNTGIALWIFGWVCLFALISWVGKEFRFVGSADGRTIEMVDPDIDYLEVSPLHRADFRLRYWLSFEPFSTLSIVDDTALVPNVRVKIFKADGDRFYTRYQAYSNGPDKEIADRNAEKIEFRAEQKDGVLFLDNALKVNRHDKFRNQIVEVSVYVPVNHRIKVDRGFSWFDRSEFVVFKKKDGYSNRSWQLDGYSYVAGREYIMLEDGLKSLNDNRQESDEKYRYQAPGIDSIQEAQQQQIRDMERSLDSTRKAHKEEMERIKDSLKKRKSADEEEARMNALLPNGWPSVQLPDIHSLQGFFSFL